MRISKKPVNSHLFSQTAKILHQAIVDLKSQQEVEVFLKSFLNNSEYTTLLKRVAIAYWLDSGKSYNNIKQNLKVSPATIASISENIKLPGIQATLKKIKAEEWASQWSQKIKNLVKVG